MVGDFIENVAERLWDALSHDNRDCGRCCLKTKGLNPLSKPVKLVMKATNVTGERMKGNETESS